MSPRPGFAALVAVVLSLSLHAAPRPDRDSAISTFGTIPMPLPDGRGGFMPPGAIRPVQFELATRTATIGDVPVAVDGSVRAGGDGVGSFAMKSRLGEENFGGLSLVANPSMPPWSMNVRVFSTFTDSMGRTMSTGCSGALIDPRFVLTAAHCVYAHSVNGRVFNSWANSVRVVPGYSRGAAPFGDAYSTRITGFNAWVDSRDYDWDMAIVELDRPVGALAGWFGYGYRDECDYFRNNVFNNPGYPGETPFNGEELYTSSGSYDLCEYQLTWYGEEITFNRRSYRGQSGSASHVHDGMAGTRTALAVVSNGDSFSTDHVRINATKFQAFAATIANAMPSTLDLTALWMQGPSTTAAGASIGNASWVLHNGSKATFSGSTSYRVYLSIDPSITAGDTLLASGTVSGTLAPRASLQTLVPGFAIPPTIAPGSYYLGVLVDIADANFANNDSSGIDAKPLQVTASTTRRAVRGDVDGNGRADVVWHRTTGETYLWSMQGAAVTAARALGAVDPAWQIVASGDFDGDGHSDLFWRRTTGENYLWFFAADGSHHALPTTSVPDLGYRVAGAGDFDGDGKCDLFWRRDDVGATYVWLMDGATVTSATPLAPVDASWKVAAIADFSGDGRADIFWRRNETGANYLWTMQGSTIASSTPLPSVPDVHWKIVAAGDFDGDARADIFWRRDVTGVNYVWTMHGTSLGAAIPTASVADPLYRVVASGDFDGDGRSDLFWRRDVTGETYVWTMNGAVPSAVASTTVPDPQWSVAAPR